MSRSFIKAIDRNNDEYIYSFFNVFNYLTTNTVKVQSLNRNQDVYGISETIVFLLKTMTSHHHFTLKHKENFKIDKEIVVEDRFYWNFSYKGQIVLAVSDISIFTQDIDILEKFLYMDNPNFGREYLEKSYLFHYSDMTNATRICIYSFFGSKNLRISDFKKTRITIEELKYFFFFYHIKNFQSFNYLEEEIEEYKDYLNWVHILIYYKKINNYFLKKYRKEIVRYLTTDFSFSCKNQNLAICYFLVQNENLSDKLKIKILENNVFNQKFIEELFQGIDKILAKGNRFLREMGSILSVGTIGHFWISYNVGGFFMKLNPVTNLSLNNEFLIELLSKKNKKIINNLKGLFSLGRGISNSRNIVYNNRFVEYKRRKEFQYVASIRNRNDEKYIKLLKNRSIEDGKIKKIVTRNDFSETGGYFHIHNDIPSFHYPNQYILDDYGSSDVIRNDDELACFGIDPMRDKFLTNFASGRNKFIQNVILKHVSAKKIQKWWKKIYFDPNHSVGKKVMKRLWEESKDLFKNEN